MRTKGRLARTKQLLTYSFRDRRAKCLMELVEALPGIIRDGIRTGKEAEGRRNSRHTAGRQEWVCSGLTEIRTTRRKRAEEGAVGNVARWGRDDLWKTLTTR